jgi:HEPN domain-containing protein
MNGKIVHEWLNKAEQDYNASKTLMRQKSISVYDVICFHCHQCIEKYLKAFLTLKNIQFPKSHDLIVLQNLASHADGTFELIKDLVKPLNSYAVQFRYPGDEAHKQDAQQSVKRMEEARKFIRNKII